MMTNNLPLSIFLIQAQELARKHKKICFVAENHHHAQWLYEILSQDRTDIVFFPEWELLPYDTLNPGPDIASQRAQAVQRLHEPSFVLVTSAHAIAYRLPQMSFYQKRSLALQSGQFIDINAFAGTLLEYGYSRVQETREPMEFAMRGSVIDFYPPFTDAPLRLEWDLDHLESIRFFDAFTQLTTHRVEKIALFPSFEYPVTESELQMCAQKAAAIWGSQNPLVQRLRQGKIPLGFIFFSPLWIGESASRLYDYLPQDTVLHIAPSVSTAAHELRLQAFKAYENMSWSYGFTGYHPEVLLADMTPPPHLQISEISDHSWELWAPECSEPWALLKHTLPSSDERWIFTFESHSRAQILSPKIKALTQQALQHYQTLNQACQSESVYSTLICPLQEAVRHAKDNIIIVPEAWLYQENIRPRSRSALAIKKRSLSKTLELRAGALVIHRDHGLARYHGLKILSFDHGQEELIELEFNQHQKLYVPIKDITLLSPYYALEQQQIDLATIGSSKWKKQLQQAKKAIDDQAAALLKIHAMRAQTSGQPLVIDETYHAFAATFAFEETPDQQQAIEEVLHDLQQPIPMDRLVCGDVGFGKTEVALRAIFVALQAGYQVVLLAPTTLLAQQHYETLLERFQSWPFRMALLSRHAAQAEQIITQLAQGCIDCVVGTHKLLQPGIVFARLALVVVDEEHRFGVQHKEALKKWRGSVNILTLTATPIPRTLSMSLQGLRDLSLITSPPAQRRSIQTMIYSNDNKIIEQAIQRELFRSGQVFYLCNDIAQHPAVVARLKALFPSARIDSVHGKLKETALERCMTQFYHQRLDILVGTTIIETGIDVPTANTMIIENAHHFGLAQLHQIRGRVGRSHHQAYAYLMIPLPLEQLSDIARARLELLVQYQDLAAGFQLATHDLEIRGAGELLGEKQSGHILDLGIDLYRQMLDEACKTLSHKKPLDTKVLLQYEIARPFAIAPQQIPDPSMRLKIYHHFEQIYDIETFLKECHAFNDRFGKALPATQDWIASHRFRILAHSWKWRQLKWRKNQPLLIEFAPKNEPESCSEKKIESFVGRHAKFITVLSPRTVALSIPTAHQQRIVSLLSNLFDSLEEDALDSEKMLWDD